MKGLGNSPLAKNGGVDFAFNRASVFSPEECEALIRWAEAKGLADVPKTNHHETSLEASTFTRRHRQLTAKRVTRHAAVVGFQRKLHHWIATLNEQVWRFDVRRFSDVLVIRYEAEDGVGFHMDLSTEYCDRKLTALVQLSAANHYNGGVLHFGLPDFAACSEQGSLLVLPAWVLHRVLPVTSGVRYAAAGFALGPSFR